MNTLQSDTGSARKEEKSAHHLEFLSRKAAEFIELKNEHNIYEFIKDSLAEIAEEAIILVNSYDESKELSTVEAVHGLKGISKAVFTILGRDLKGMRTPIREHDRSELLARKLMCRKMDYHTLSGGKLSHFTSLALEKVFPPGLMYGMGFAKENILYGNVVFILKRNVQLANPKLVEAFVHLASIALQKRKSDDLIRGALKEKELLLKEMNHRVKNNLQIVAGMLNVKKNAFSDPSLKEVLAECQAKIGSIAAIHNHLYRSNQGGCIEISSFIEDVIEKIQGSGDYRRITIDCSIPEMNVDFSTAVNFGLLLNELLTNSYKHAFPGNRSGTVRIALEKNRKDQYVFSYSDNGVGFPGKLDIPGSSSLGLVLISSFSDQLGGKLSVKSVNGLHFTILIENLHTGSLSTE